MMASGIPPDHKSLAPDQKLVFLNIEVKNEFIRGQAYGNLTTPYLKPRVIKTSLNFTIR